MKYNFAAKLYGRFYLGSCKKELRKRNMNLGKIKMEYKKIILHAKDIGKSRLLNAYFMAAYFIAMNRAAELSPEENYRIFEAGLYQSRLLRIALGNADSYLSPKKMPARKEWSLKSHERHYENDWVVDILEKSDEYELGYNYYTCGICSLCKDEGCPELAKYLCRLDFVVADIMGMELKRTQTIAEGADHCDFRYSRRKAK